MTTIALFGAGGKMGMRLGRSLRGDEEYRVLYVEPSETGRKRLSEELGASAISGEDAAREADVVILAVPDTLIGRVATEVVPLVRPGVLIMTLDPAAAYAGRLPERADVAYFVTHPTHPPLFDLLEEEDPKARKDFWGGGIARQGLVSAIAQGTDQDYARGEKIAKRIFQPIHRAHRITVEQMALLEPAMSESIAVTCVAVLRETMDEVIRRGVPEQAVKDFMLGHIQIDLAILFDALDWEMSAGAQQAVREAMPSLFRDDWKKLLETDEIKASVRRITGEVADQTL
jgi:hypothetical protein